MFLNIKLKKNPPIHTFSKVQLCQFPRTGIPISTNKNIKKETLETFLKILNFLKKNTSHTFSKVRFCQFPRTGVHILTNENKKRNVSRNVKNVS